MLFRSDVLQRYKLMRSYGLSVGALGVITPHSVSYAETIANWLEDNDIISWDFLLGFEPPESNNDLTISNEEAASFMTNLFDAWFDRDNPRIRIRTFRDIIRSELGNKPVLCSWQRGCVKFASFDNYGNVFLCTKFHVYPETVYGNVMKKPFSDILDSSNARTMNEEICNGVDECKKCEWLNSCGGGCSFDRYAIYKKLNAPFIH